MALIAAGLGCSVRPGSDLLPIERLARAQAAVIPGCEDQLTPSVIESLDANVDDPLQTFLAWRREHRVSIKVPPRTECLHRAWLSLHHLEPPDAIARGDKPSVAINPGYATMQVAAANTTVRDPNPTCQSPTATAARTFGTTALYSSRDNGRTWKYQCAPWPASLTGGVPNAVAWFGSEIGRAHV